MNCMLDMNPANIARTRLSRWTNPFVIAEIKEPPPHKGSYLQTEQKWPTLSTFNTSNVSALWTLYHLWLYAHSKAKALYCLMSLWLIRICLTNPLPLPLYHCYLLEFWNVIFVVFKSSYLALQGKNVSSSRRVFLCSFHIRNKIFHLIPVIKVIFRLIDQLEWLTTNLQWFIYIWKQEKFRKKTY